MTAHLSRRRVLAAMAVSAVPMIDAGLATVEARHTPHGKGEDELLRLGAEFDRLFSQWKAARAESRRTDDELFRALVAAGLAVESARGRSFNHFGDEASRARHDELSASTGHDVAWAAWSEAEAALFAVADRIADLEPSTPAGLAVRARAVLWEHYSGSVEDDWREPVDKHEARLAAVLDLATRLGGASVLA